MVLAAAPRQTPQQRPVFRGGAVLVTVDAYPQRDGRIVEGLTAADFEILEDGKPQTVEKVEFVRIEPSLSEATRRDPNTQAEAMALAADPHNRVFITFLDALHTTIGGSHNIRRPLVDALNRIVGPDDLFAVVTQNIDPRHMVLGRRLLGVEEQLSRYWPWGERQRITSDPADPVEDYLERCFHLWKDGKPWLVNDGAVERTLDEVLIDRRREDRTFNSLESLIRFMSGRREARTILLVVTDGWLLFTPERYLENEVGRWAGGPPAPYVTGGKLGISSSVDSMADRANCNTEALRLARLDNERRLRDLMDLANRGNMSFYPIAAGGLGVFDDTIAAPTIPSGRGSPLVQSMSRVTERADALLTAANNTNGIAIVNTNDLDSGLKRIVDDVSAYYLLEYYSTNTRNDGRFRRIEVKMRPKDVAVKARRGYLAPTEDAASGGAAPRAASGAVAPAAVDEALAELSRLGPNAELFTRGFVEGRTLVVSVEIPSSRMIGGPWMKGATADVSAVDASGTVVGAGSAPIAPAARGTLVRVPLPPTGDGPWRVVSKVTGGSASIEDRIDVRIGRASILGEPILYRGTPAATSALRPVADRQYRRTERVHVEWAIQQPPDQRSARLLGRNGQPLAVPVTLTERTTDGRPVLAADLNLAPLSAGDYVIEVVVSQGANEARSLVAIRVVP